MPGADAYGTDRLPATNSAILHLATRWAVVLALHGIALGILLWFELDPVSRIAFLATWGLLNFCWLTLLRRPTIAAALSLAMFAALIMVSAFKHDVLLMTANFVDVMVIDSDTVAFLMMIVPTLAPVSGIVAIVGISALIMMWRLDSFRIRRRTALWGALSCFAGLAGLSFAIPVHPFEEFTGANYVSKFARSGVTAIVDYVAHGYLESDSGAGDHLAPAADESCRPAAKLPHIILLHDESSFDIRALSGITVPAGYGPHFQSVDAKSGNLSLRRPAARAGSPNTMC